MNTKQAVAQRITDLCQERGIAVNTLANTAGIPPSTLYSIIGEKSKSPEIITIKKICDGFGISLAQFFNTEIFNQLEQEIK